MNNVFKVLMYDGKFFKVEFQRWSHSQGDLLEQTATEVFRKEVISYEYF